MEEAAKWSFLVPLIVGTFVGIIDYIPYYLFTTLGRPLIGVLSIVVTAELLRGFNHLDGLLDIGDAIMAKRGRENMMKALKDPFIGTGGMGVFLIYVMEILVFYSSGSGLSLLEIIASEVVCRVIGILILSVLKPMEGSFLGATFHRHLKGKWYLVLAQGIPFLLAPVPLLLFLFFLLMGYGVARNVLGGSSGDLAGFIITLSFPLLLVGESVYPPSWFYYLPYL